MIYLTGDTHGDFRRFSTRIFPEQKQMTKNDYVIILGDFAGIWAADPENSMENYWLNWLDKEKPFTTLFIDGKHENYDRLYAYHVREWKGGKVHEIRPSVLHLMRGQIFDLCGKTFFTFGGARSHDIRDGIFEADDPALKRIRRLAAEGYAKYQELLYRVNHVSWWEQELPSEEEYREGTANLKEADIEVDHILTHCLPTSLQLLAGEGRYEPDPLTEYLEQIRKLTTYKCWFCGHYHWDHNLTESEKILYSQIVRVV